MVTISDTSTGRIFEGIGAISAGASSRLLTDYPEVVRSHILDYLFLPDFGASLQDLKVEIGGGENSTCGSEPSHAYNKEELLKPVDRGYEFWLMNEARRCNPQITLNCLPWSYPGFLSGKFTQESAEWFASFLDVAREKYDININWVSAAQNEWNTDLNWVTNILRPTLDHRGFKNVKLQAPDDINDRAWKIFDDFDNYPDAVKVIDAMGYHYVNGREPWSVDAVGMPATEKAKNSGKSLWASEEWSTGGGRWALIGALYVARLINKLYIRDHITKVEFWRSVMVSITRSTGMIPDFSRQTSRGQVISKYGPRFGLSPIQLSLQSRAGAISTHRPDASPTHGMGAMLRFVPRQTINTIPAYLYKPVWQYVLAKPAQELHTTKGNRRLFGTIAVIFVPEGDTFIVDTNDPLVGNGYPMRVLAQVFYHVFGFAQRRSAIHHPRFVLYFFEQSLIRPEQLLFVQVPFDAFHQFSLKNRT